MKIVSQGKGCYWKTDDAAGLSFNEVDRGDAPPTDIECAVIGTGYAKVSIDSLQLLGVGLFGEGRPCGFNSTTKWTGSSHKFGVYESPGSYRRGIVILMTHGAGMEAFFIANSWTIDLWRYLCATLPSERLWDACHEIADAYKAGQTTERRKIHQRFIDGRLKVASNSGQKYIKEVREK